MVFHFGGNYGGFNAADFAQQFHTGFRGQGSGKRPPSRKPVSAVKSVVLSLVITVVFGAAYFYIALPEVNVHSGAFWFFLLLLLAVYSIFRMVFMGTNVADGQQVKKSLRIPGALIAVILAIAVIGSLISWVVFRSGSYSKLLTVNYDGDFATDVEELSFDQIPLLDSDSAQRLGNRKLGELSDMVSQFEVASDYTQINYKGKPVRVTPLVYGDIIKWFNNRSEGIPAYLVIDMTTSNVDVVRLSDGIKYTTAEHFGRNLYRYLRFNYPVYMFEEPAFEIDEEGNPWWICARIQRTIGLFGGRDVCGAVLVNAVTGETTYYTVSEVPEWVDRVYNASLIMNQYDYYGRYHNGFINSIFGQRDVTVTTDGYNYIALGDDVYMYTGVTSVGGDASNVGFLLCNQRTKQCSYYSCAGAEEYSAMESAEGIVQQMEYEATFPILLNISGQPTYFMALKDSAGLVKQYAMVNMAQYQIVSNGTTVQGCLSSYLDLMKENGLAVTTVVDETAAADQKQVEGTVDDIRSAVIAGTTVYYISLTDTEGYYTVSAAESPAAALLNAGDRVTLSVTDDSPLEKNELRDASSLSIE